MTDDSKSLTLALFFLALIAMVLIAAALPQLELAPGIPLPRLESAMAAEETEPPPPISLSISSLLKTILVIALIVFTTAVGFKFRKKIPWRDILAPSLFITLLGLIVLYVLFLLQNVQINSMSRLPEIVPPEVDIRIPETGSVNLDLVWLVWIVLAAGLIFSGIAVFYWAVRQTRSADRVRQEAEQAIRALKTGSELKSVILRCYWQMSQALQKERGIELEQTMTARDFETLLENRGVPREPVRQLTRLFEGARYGFRQPGAEEERMAIDCLTAIVQFSRANRPAE